MKKVLALMLVLALVLCVAVGCAKEEAAAPAEKEEAAAPAEKEEAPAETEEAPAEFNPADYPIGYCGILRTHPVVQLMIGGFVDAAQKLGYPYYLYVPDDGDASKAYALAEAGVAQHNLKGMVQYILDDSTPMYIQKWQDAGIVVTSAHTFLDESVKEDYPGLAAWAACSAETYGKASAQAIGTAIGGKGTVAVTEGAFNPTEDAAAVAFIAEMNAAFPDVVVLDPQEEGYDTPTAIQKATAITQATPDLVAAFSTTGAGCSTWAGAIDNTGRDLTVISMDYSEVNLDLVKEGKIYGIVAQPLYHAFYESVVLLDKHFKGESYEWANEIEAPIVTAETVDEYYELTAYVNDVMSKVG